MTVSPTPGTHTDLSEAIDERAAILELEAGLPRDLAADVAFLNVCSEQGLGCMAGAAPFHRLPGRCDSAEADRVNRFLREEPSLGNDEFINWLLLLPYVEPTACDRPAPDFTEDWQIDAEWWAQHVA